MLHNSALTHRYISHTKGHLHKCTWVLHTLTHMYLILGQKWPYEHNGINRISRIGAKPLLEVAWG